MNRSLILNKNSYLHKTGWLDSLTEGIPVDEYGNPLPWMNYNMISLLKERLSSDHSLFEYGSGYSTHFFAKRVKDVTSVEYDERWYRDLKDGLPSNAKVILRHMDYDGDYCRTILETNKRYDVIVVDSRDRVNCTKVSLDRLKPEGVLIFGDSQREQYLSAHEFMLKKDFRHLHFEGLKPSGASMDRTTLYYRPFNCFDL